MRYMRTYPTERQLKELAYNIPFPITAGDMTVVAKYMNCSPTILRLLRRFDADDLFENGVDFINRCEEVKLFVEEERGAPRELLRSPQD